MKKCLLKVFKLFLMAFCLMPMAAWAAAGISGRVTGPGGVTPLAGISVYAYRWTPGYRSTVFLPDDWNIGGWGETGGDGRYTISGLPSGTYRLSFGDYHDSGVYAQEFYNNAWSFGAGKSIAYTAGTSVRNINATLGYAAGTPEGVVATDGVYTDRVVITWRPAANATHYRVYRHDFLSETKKELGSWQSDTWFVDKSVMPGKSYDYYVVAAKSSAGAYPSNQSVFESGYRKLLPPTGVAASDGAYCDRVVITWRPVWGATRYRVYRDDGLSSTALGSWGFNTWFVDKSAVPGRTYEYHVVAAKSSAGYFPSQNSTKNPGYRNLSPPTGLWASAGKYHDRITVSWRSVAGASHYRVFRAGSPTGAKTAVGGWQTTTVFNDGTAQVGKGYYYFIQASLSDTGRRHSSFSGSVYGWRSRAASATVSASSSQAVPMVAAMRSPVEEGLGSVTIPIPASGTLVSAVLHDGDASRTLLDAVPAPAAVTVPGIEAGRPCRLEVATAETAGTASAPLYTVDILWQADPPADLAAKADALPEDGMDALGSPIVEVQLPEADGPLTLKCYDAVDGVLETRTGVEPGTKASFTLPAWGRWHWIGAWRDESLVFSLWLRHEVEE